MKTVLLILIGMASISYGSAAQDLPTAEKVDLRKYTGTWYEIARLPNSFEKGLECVTATYTLKENGKIRVLNKGYSAKKGKYQTAKGTAWVPDKAFPGRLTVTFFWPFSGNYYIISLEEHYQYALVGDPSRKFLWVLARSKSLDESIYSELLDQAKNLGFDTNSILRISHNCE
jgi:apolipoprotein D and lipocalin family protein